MSVVSKAVTDLLPEIRSRREEIEQTRRLPRDLADALRATGIFALGVPRSLGGAEAEPAQTLNLTETIAAADGSTGWCAMIGMAGGAAAGYLNETGAKEIYADPAAPTAGIARPAGQAIRTDGGVTVTGRWPFASGITHCDWVFGGCMIFENGAPKMTPHGPEIVHAFMPVSELEIHDTWYVSGMAGTGSVDFSADGVFVPEHRVFSLFDSSTHRSEPLYQMPPLGGFAAHVVTVGLGIARAALDEIAELAQTKVPTLSMAVLADKPVAQVEIARAEAALGAARSFLHESIGDIWRTVSAGGAPDQRQLAQNRIACIQAAETAAAVARTANVLGGGSSLYASSSLQRHARDAEAITHHFTVSPHVWEEAGRVLMGRAPTAPIF